MLPVAPIEIRRERSEKPAVKCVQPVAAKDEAPLRAHVEALEDGLASWPALTGEPEIVPHRRQNVGPAIPNTFEEDLAVGFVGSQDPADGRQADSKPLATMATTPDRSRSTVSATSRKSKVMYFRSFLTSSSHRFAALSNLSFMRVGGLDDSRLAAAKR